MTRWTDRVRDDSTRHRPTSQLSFVCMCVCVCVKLTEGERDVSEHFSLSMEVFPSSLNHNGVLFSVGSRPNFEYYEWKTAAVNTQFIVVEFIFSAVIQQTALVIKTYNNCNRNRRFI